MERKQVAIMNSELYTIYAAVGSAILGAIGYFGRMIFTNRVKVAQVEERLDAIQSRLEMVHTENKELRQLLIMLIEKK